MATQAKKYPVIVGYTHDEVMRDEYVDVEAFSAKDAAEAALQRQFDRGESYEMGEYTVTVLVDGKPKKFSVMAEADVLIYATQ